MKARRLLAGIGALCLTLTLLAIPTQVHAQESSSTTIKTTVPSTHTVRLNIGMHGSVTVNGKTYTYADKVVDVPRLAGQTYIIKADTNWQIDTVRYGETGKEEIVKLDNGTFQAPELTSDEYSLLVTYKEASNTGTSGTGNNSNASNVQTGDTTNIKLYLIFLGCAFATMLFGIRLKEK